MKVFAALLVGMALLSSVVGCCCGHGGCSPYGAACPTGACGAAPGGYPLGVAPQGMYQGASSVQANYQGTATTPVIYGTAAYPGGYSQTALAPLEPLPTY